MSACLHLKRQPGRVFLVNHGVKDCDQCWDGLGWVSPGLELVQTLQAPGELPGALACGYGQRGKTGKSMGTRHIKLED